MAALFDNLSMFEDEDKVGVSHCRETVGDDEACTSLHQLVETFLDKDFAAGVDIAGRFIQ